MSETDKSQTAIPLVEERLRVDKRAVETGRVRVRTVVDEHLARVADELESEDVSIERVPVNQEVTAVPPVREEGDTLIVPLVEEVVVVEKRLVVREELRIRRNRRREPIEESVRVRRMRAEVERVPTRGSGVAPDAGSRRPGSARLRRKAPLTEPKR